MRGCMYASYTLEVSDNVEYDSLKLCLMFFLHTVGSSIVTCIKGNMSVLC